ncbi:MAG: GxxExxY protein [Limisphaerales bacterium]
MKSGKADLVFKDECFAVMGACFAVYKDKGCGFLEPVYHECMEIELAHLRIPAVSKPKLSLEYRGQPLSQGYEPDFVCWSKIILELKAVAALAGEHRAQVLNYLNATGFQLGLLVNFGHYPLLEWERIANTHRNVQPSETVDLKNFRAVSRVSRAKS